MKLFSPSPTLKSSFSVALPLWRPLLPRLPPLVSGSLFASVPHLTVPTSELKDERNEVRRSAQVGLRFWKRERALAPLLFLCFVRGICAAAPGEPARLLSRSLFQRACERPLLALESEV